ncbi:unnamed protein product [Schistosoma curassoni]|uniref:Uncharacterized protein n=1 Tax=Schistosoma curassoni TaxID=6186 RepID=A0A183K5F0_9TREM|nr:unnamed protein product [Schistosoma curassoni]
MPLVRLEANATNAVEANSRKSGSVSHKIRQHSVHVKSISLAGITENSADFANSCVFSVPSKYPTDAQSSSVTKVSNSRRTNR